MDKYIANISDDIENIYATNAIYVCYTCVEPDEYRYQVLYAPCLNACFCDGCIDKLIEMTYNKRLYELSQKAYLLKEIFHPDIYSNIIRYFRPLTLSIKLKKIEY